jgi:hypothetical protein
MAYQDDVTTSEGVRQTSKAATNTAAGHLAADILHYQNLVIAGRKWGVRNHAAQALLNLGGSIPAPGPQQGDF